MIGRRTLINAYLLGVVDGAIGNEKAAVPLADLVTLREQLGTSLALDQREAGYEEHRAKDVGAVLKEMALIELSDA